jgi:hypothetical protein
VSHIVWKDVPGFPGYRASSEGNVETQWRKGFRHPLAFNNGKPFRTDEWLPVVTNVHQDGYLQFNVPKEANPVRNKRWVYKVHYFVCLAFHGVPSEGQEVRHFPDGNPQNNRPENLRWGTHAENMGDTIVQGTSARGSRSGNAKLTESDIPTMFELRRQGWTNTQIAEKFGVTQPVVCTILKGKSWTHVTSQLIPDDGGAAIVPTPSSSPGDTA